MNIITLRDGTNINASNVAFTMENVGYPPGMTEEDAIEEGLSWPITVVVFSAAIGDYGYLDLHLAHDERTEFLSKFITKEAK